MFLDAVGAIQTMLRSTYREKHLPGQYLVPKNSTCFSVVSDPARELLNPLKGITDSTQANLCFLPSSGLLCK